MSRNLKYEKQFDELAEKIVWTPHERQKFVTQCPAAERFFGGAKGGGMADR